VDNHLGGPGRLRQERGVAHIPGDELEGVPAEILPQPGQIPLCAGAAEVIVNDDFLTALEQAVDVVRTDESCAARDQKITRHFSPDSI
jgi:hypothetical protein